MTRHARTIAFSIALLAPAGSAAQQSPLDEVERLAASGRMSQARAALERWDAGHPPADRTVGADDRALALLLRGRLATDAAAALEAYRALVLSYPSSRSAPDALLRLGQGLLAANDAVRAALYLDRLVTDFPRSPHLPVALLWLARARATVGDRVAACEAATAGVREAGADADLGPLLRTEQESQCAAAPAPTATVVTAAPAPAAAARATAPETVAAGDFAVQSAALRNRAGADALAARIRRAGFDARITMVEGSALVRVRVGRFPSRAAATAAARDLRTAGFEAVVVDDVARERPAR
jgi:hypothetical protein